MPLFQLLRIHVERPDRQPARPVTPSFFEQGTTISRNSVLISVEHFIMVPPIFRCYVVTFPFPGAYAGT